MDLAFATSFTMANPITSNASAQAAAPQRKSAKNAKFANDGSWESVEKMLQKFAAKAFKRVDDLGLGMEFEDVMGEMRVGYVKALQKFDASQGILFSTYCFSVCRNHFNEIVKKPERERTQFGMTSYDSYSSNADDGDHDVLERIPEAAGHEMSTEDSLIAREEFHERMKGLSQGARRLITALLVAERQAGADPAPKLRELARSVGLVDDELRQVKEEILTKFGIRWL